jgi:hypothetical protein
LILDSRLLTDQVLDDTDISIDYLGESFAGDELIIVMWQDHKDVSKLSFSIYKTKDKKQLTYVLCHLGLDEFNVNWLVRMKVAIHVTKSDNGPPLEGVLWWVGYCLSQ